jgi:pantothenate kinase
MASPAATETLLSAGLWAQARRWATDEALRAAVAELGPLPDAWRPGGEGEALEVVAAGLKQTVRVSAQQLRDVYLPLCAFMLAELRASSRARVVVAVAGRSGAGKTTTSLVLGAVLNRLRPRCCCVVGMDGWHLTNAELSRRGLRALKGRPETFDLDGFAATLARAAASCERVLLPDYDRNVHEPRADAVEVAAECRVLIAEGLFVVSDRRVCAMSDLRVYVEAAPQVSAARVVQRRQMAGKSETEAREWSRRVDEPNAELIRRCRGRCHVVLSSLPPRDPSASVDLGAELLAPPPMHARALAARLLARHGGVLRLRDTLVCRGSYCGRDLLGANSSPDAKGADERGYLPVERWVASTTEAENPLPLASGAREGVSSVSVDEGDALPLDALADAVLGEWRARWPLVKILDIGGAPQRPRLDGGDDKAAPEVPPIPVHVHRGVLVDGRVLGPGKDEAYFFPPLAHAPFSQREPAMPPVTRLGLRPDATRAAVLAALERFGADDSMYALLNAFPARQGEGWMVPAGVVHAPGPRLTLEMQRPQDDYNLLAWKLGCRLCGQELDTARAQHMLKGFASVAELLDRMVDWERSASPRFESEWRRVPQELARGAWGRRRRVFFDLFRGDEIELLPGVDYSPEPEREPFAVRSSLSRALAPALSHASRADSRFQRRGLRQRSSGRRLCC